MRSSHHLFLFAAGGLADAATRVAMLTLVGEKSSLSRNNREMCA
jgi:hypothetical protein